MTPYILPLLRNSAAASCISPFKPSRLRSRASLGLSTPLNVHNGPSSAVEPPPSKTDRQLFGRLEPYLELSRVRTPVGSALLFLPCASSIALASSAISAAPQVLVTQSLIFAIGALVMRGAGCTINDLWDRSIDREVERTRSRPLAKGTVTVPAAIGWLGLQLSVGLAVLLQLNAYSIFLGASSLMLVVIYPLMKRITYWPQLVLGLAFNWGALLGSSAILGQTDWIVSVPLYLGHVCWTIVYDTIYAQQDKESDLKAGVKSTALLFGPHPVPALASFSTAFVCLTALSGYLNGCGIGFYGLSVIAPALHLTHLLKNLDPESPEACGRSFKASTITGSLVWLGSLLDYCSRCLF
ncbi:para-hydroxybenzoate-polyprenyltransferase [Phakopsora pachyrhizi]|nr:para-hydroxybenzoate-polyprenyltransferase [Phakopsora pachyrhizi]